MKLLSKIIFVLLVFAIHGCATNPQKREIATKMMEYDKLFEEARFDKIIEDFESHGGFNDPALLSFQYPYLLPEYNDMVNKICISYSRIRNFSKFAQCIDFFDESNKRLAKLPLDDRVKQWAKLGIIDVTLLKSERALTFSEYDAAIKYANNADDLLRKDTELKEWENSSYSIRNREWAFRAIQTQRLYGLSYAFKGNAPESRNSLSIINKIDLSLSSTPEFKKEKNASVAQIALAIGEYQTALDAIEQYDNISGFSLLGSTAKLFLNPLSIIEGIVGVVSEVSTAAENDDLVSQAYYNIPKAFIKAKATYELGRTEEALKLYKELIDTKILSTYGNVYYLVLQDMGKIAMKYGKYEDAYALFAKSIDAIESQRASINTEASKIGFVGDKQAVYRDTIDLLIRMKRFDEALAYVERGKARALVDILASKQQFGSNVSQGNILVASLNSAEVDMSSVKAAGDSQQRSANRALLRKRQQDIQQAQPELASLVTVSAPSIADLQKRLPANETLVEYYGDDKQLYAFVMSHNGVGAVKLDGSNIHQLISRFRNQINQPKSVTYKTTGLQLYNRLLAPVAKQLKTSNLTIVPHGALHYLPFSALPTPRGHMIDQYSLRVLPSASVLQFLNKQHKPKGTLLALGNPDLNDKSLDLPGAQQEAVAIAKQLPKAQLLLRARATETAVKQHGGAYKYLHFASHGVFDPEKPLQSGLLLSKDAANDGNLTVGELYDLNLNADLVTLSACETALGKVANGDDVVGFTRGFLYAGAKSIVSSLWKVDDAATNKLMQSFYTNMSKQDKRSALRTAQLTVKEKYQHPYYWAAFQITGAVN